MSNSRDSLNRSDIELSLVKEFPDLTRAQISKSIDAIIDSISETVAKDKKVEIRGFGTFSKKFSASSEKISDPELEISFEKFKMIFPLKN